MTDLQDITLARVWEKSKREIQVIFLYVEELLKDYPCTLLDIRFKRSTQKGSRYKLLANIRQDSLYTDLSANGLYSRINNALNDQYLMTVKPYWEELSKAFRQNLNFVVFDNSGIICYLNDNDNPIKFYSTPGSGENTFPKDYASLLRELREPLQFLVVGQVIPILMEYAKSDKKTTEARYIAIYTKCQGDFDRLVRELKKLQDLKNKKKTNA